MNTQYPVYKCLSAYALILSLLVAPAITVSQSRAQTTLNKDGDIFSKASPSATLTVTNTNDSGTGSLRQAIADATPGDTINFSVTGTITLTSGQLFIDKNLTIQGPGASRLSISGNHTSRVFFINQGVTTTLEGMTIRDGDGSDGGGGGIYNSYGTLTITNCTISDNKSNDGGGIVSWGMLTVTNSTISDNRAGYYGGILSSGTLTVINSAISDNTATSGFGGGIDYVGTLTISNSTVAGNFGIGIEKGGTYGDSESTISDSTISGNSGRGISNRGGSLVINNCTISHNTGDGIYNAAYCDTNCYDGLVSITNSTISGNGVGIFSNNSGEGPALERLRNTLVAGNTNSDISGTIETANHNLIGNAASSGGITNGVNGNIVGVNPLLGPLRNNRGPTRTHALRAGSPAINAGDNCVLIADGCGDGNPALPTDQRGMPRNGTVDIGAFERQNNEISSTAPFDYDGDGKSDISVWRPSDGIWYIIQSGSASVRAQGWGLNGDKVAPADFDGDGKTDLAVFRPSESNWYINNSATDTVSVAGWGLPGDMPVPADYSGDGKADLAVYRPSEGKWYRRDSDGQIHVQAWGLPGDKPAPADFNGDGVADMTVFRPSEGKWYILNSGNAAITEFTWGLNGDLPIPGDYSGDGKSDFAVFRASNQTWYRIHSDDFAVHVTTWGLAGDFPDTRRLRRRRTTRPRGLASIERNLVHLRIAIRHLLAALGTKRRYSYAELVRLLTHRSNAVLAMASGLWRPRKPRKARVLDISRTFRGQYEHSIRQHDCKLLILLQRRAGNRP
jgi:hypothetical protein